MEKLSLVELKNYIASNGVVAAKEKYEKQVLEANDPFQSLLFCLNIKTADVKAHEQIMLNGNDLASAFQFVMDVEGADKKAFEKKFLDAKEIKYNSIDFSNKITPEVEKNIEIIASDVNENALNNAKQNIKKYKLEDKIKVVLSDGLSKIDIKQNSNAFNYEHYLHFNLLNN